MTMRIDLQRCRVINRLSKSPNTHRHSRLCLSCFEKRINPTAGLLDPSFGVGGTVMTRLPGPSSDVGQSVAIDSSGRIIVAGTTSNGSNDDFGITRYTATGAIDESFGKCGTVTISIGPSDDRAYAVAVDSLNRVIVAGSTKNGSQYDFAAARLTINGELDNTFDADGMATIDFDPVGDDEARGIVVDAADSIVIAGSMKNSIALSSTFAIARLTVNGTLDPTFDTDGKQAFGFGAGNSAATSAALDSMGRIVVAGGSGSQGFAIARLLGNGSLDSNFDSDGRQTVTFGLPYQLAFGVAVDSQDQVIVAGVAGQLNSSTDAAVCRLTAIGQLDTGFDADGKQTLAWNGSLDQATAVAVDSIDRVIVSGRSTSGPTDFQIARLPSSGALDGSFDSDGKQSVGFGPFSAVSFAVATDSTDRIVVAGYGATQALFTSDFAVTRLSPSGALDLSFDGDGKQTTPFGESNCLAKGVAVDSQNRVIVVGQAFDEFNYEFAITRYTASGSLDTTFGGTGIVTIDFGPWDDSATSVVIDALDRVIVCGSMSNGSLGDDFAVARLTSLGLLDSSFDADGKQTIDFGSLDLAYAASVDSLGRILVAGETLASNDMAVARLTPGGELDSSFDDDGKQTVDFGGGQNDWANGVAVDSMNRVVLAGVSLLSPNYDFAVARLTESGVLDVSFDADGRTTIDRGDDFGYGVAIDSLDRVVVVGTTNLNPFGPIDYDGAILRFTAAGDLDSSFDSDGTLTISFGQAYESAYCVAVDSLDRVVVAGSAFNVVRLTNTGALDASFDNGMTSGVFGNTDGAHGVAIDSYGRIVAAGSADANGQAFAVARLTGDHQPPKLVSITVNDGSPQRSMVTSLKVAFNSPVSFASAPTSAFQLNRRGDNALVTLSAAVDGTGTLVTLTFTGGAINGPSLADGRYTLKILAHQFSGLGFDGNGNTLADGSPADDYVFAAAAAPSPPTNIFRMFGDANGDGAVSLSDFIQFRQAIFGASPIFDFDGDGSVSANDFVRFRMRFGGSI